MGHKACTEPQCLYRGALYIYIYKMSESIPFCFCSSNNNRACQCLCTKVADCLVALQGHHVDIVRLKEIGEHFCDALACLHSQLYWRRGMMACSPGPLRLLHLHLQCDSRT